MSYKYNRPVTGLLVLASPVLLPVAALVVAIGLALKAAYEVVRDELPGAAGYAFREPAVAATRRAQGIAGLVSSRVAFAAIGLYVFLSIVAEDVYYDHVKFRLAALLDVPAVLLELLIQIVIEGRDTDWSDKRDDFVWAFRGIGAALRTGQYY